MSDNTIGERIRARREHLDRVFGGYSQRDVAVQLGLSTVGYGHYERGRSEITASDLARLAEILKCRPSYFYGEEDAAEPLPTDPATKGDVDRLLREIDARFGLYSELRHALDELDKRLDELEQPDQAAQQRH